MQPLVGTSNLTPASIIDAQVLQVSASTHRTTVQTIGAVSRSPGQQLAAAIDPIDVARALAGVPAILSNDQRQARILRGI